MKDCEKVCDLAYAISLLNDLIDSEQVDMSISNDSATIDLSTVRTSEGKEIISKMLEAFRSSCECNTTEDSSMMLVHCVIDKLDPFFTPHAVDYIISIKNDKLGFEFTVTVYGTGDKPENCSLIELKRITKKNSNVQMFLDALRSFSDEFYNGSQFV